MILHPRLIAISRYLDGDLNERETRRVAAHIERCPHCREKIASFASLEVALGYDAGLSEEATGDLLGNLPPAPWSKNPPIASVEKLSGGCRVQPAFESEPIDAFEGLGLRENDRLKVESSSRVLIQLDDGSQIWLNGGASATLGNGDASLLLTEGELFARMRPQTVPFAVQTPTARLTVLGTTFEAGVTPWESTFLRVLEGKVAFRNQAGECLAGPRREVDATAHQAPIAQKIRKVAEVARWVCLPLPGDGLFDDPKDRPRILRLPGVMPVAAVLIALMLALGLGWFSMIRPGLTVSEPAKTWQPPAQTVIDDSRELVFTGVQWPVGYRFVFRFDLNMTSRRTAAGTLDPSGMELKQSQEIVFNVTGRRHNGARDVVMSFRDIRFEIRQGGQGLVIDSQSELRERSNHPFAAILRAQQDARFDVQISRSGEITVFEGFAAFKENVLDQVGPGQADVIGDFLHEEFYRRMFALSLPQSFRESGVNQKSWDALAPFGTGEDSTANQAAHYRFENWDLHNGHQCAMMSVVLEDRQDGQSATPHGNGQVWYDPQLGMIIKTIWMLERQAQLPADMTSEPGASVKISQYLQCRLVEVESRKSEVEP